MNDERKFFYPDSEAPDDWVAYQADLVRQAVRIGWEGSREIRQRLEGAGVRPKDICTPEDLASIPALSKDELPNRQAAEPLFGGMLAVPVEQLRAIYQSPGPILDPHGEQPDYWRTAPALWAAGFRAGHIVVNSFSYHLTPAGAMFDVGLHAIGCVVVPGGVGNTEQQVELIAQVGAVGYVGTPDFLLTIMQRARAHGVNLAFRRAYVSGGPLPPSLRSVMEDDFALDVYQGYGTADAGTIAYECAAKSGWHVAPNVVVEIVDPASGEVVAVGATGEVVVTVPNTVYPLLRFGTGDLSAFITDTCSCGRTSPRLVGFQGRVGDGIKVRGMFVHPGQLARVLAKEPAVSRYQGVVSRHEHRDEFKVLVECNEGADFDPGRLAEAIRAGLKVRAEVEAVNVGTIEEGAPQLIDARKRE